MTTDTISTNIRIEDIKIKLAQEIFDMYYNIGIGLLIIGLVLIIAAIMIRKDKMKSIFLTTLGLSSLGMIVTTYSIYLEVPILVLMILIIIIPIICFYITVGIFELIEEIQYHWEKRRQISNNNKNHNNK